MFHKSIWKWQRHRKFISGIIIRLEHFDFGIMEDNLELHLNSWNQQANDRAHSTVLGGSMEIEEGSGSGNIQVNSRNEVEDVEGYLNEKKRALNDSRSGYVGNLTRIHNEKTAVPRTKPQRKWKSLTTGGLNLWMSMINTASVWLLVLTRRR